MAKTWKHELKLDDTNKYMDKYIKNKDMEKDAGRTVYSCSNLKSMSLPELSLVDSDLFVSVEQWKVYKARYLDVIHDATERLHFKNCGDILSKCDLCGRFSNANNRFINCDEIGCVCSDECGLEGVEAGFQWGYLDEGKYAAPTKILRPNAILPKYWISYCREDYEEMFEYLSEEMKERLFKALNERGLTSKESKD